ncbi:DNA damage-inducible protein D [Flavobacterium piscisymbiosum]|uniref:DNA damage-inducible protein D n=1 Tax=Flavobacterium piscisymbiosum TaxID=2893753 RepID=A0ABS8M8Y3_9FLAO|nr:DNA damage-inducible protein D [Flavobacterium sp. F-30]MCC9061949.1 DNA damage-inducible protein D [Flavobacterium sp. F-30]
MKNELIKSLTTEFEDYSQKTEAGIEFWFARDIQHLLGYSEWRNFNKVILKAKTSCEITGHLVLDHFVDVNKKVVIGSGTEREIDDIMLTRYACYLIAQNGDPRKEQIAFAQNYFAIQTRKFEEIAKRIDDWERLNARQKLTSSEKELSELIFEKTGNDKDFGIIRSKGDQALFGGKNTLQMKKKLGVPESRPLADFLPTIVIKAKDFAAEITVFNTKDKGLSNESSISSEHVKNNKGVRKLLLDREIIPENLPAEEDIKKLERRVNSETKSIEKNPDKLS